LAAEKKKKKAIEKLDIMYLDKEEREIYENDLKRLRIQKAELKTAERKGREEGREEGRLEGEKEKSITIAKNLLAMGMDILTVVKATGLDEAEIEKLK